ncbi:unnamed protein product [Arabidopsis lyrata]|nr:unnamed protein product [Arabidopsis lyrata]
MNKRFSHLIFSGYRSSTYEPRRAVEQPKRETATVEKFPARKPVVKERDINERAEAFIQKFRKQLLLQR